MAWIKADTKAILAIHEHVITNNARLSVTHNDFNTWTLNLRGVKREDRGQYMCQVNTDPMKSQVSEYTERFGNKQQFSYCLRNIYNDNILLTLLTLVRKTVIIAYEELHMCSL